ncbi:MAG TPA: hypothetical protein VK162_14340 [Streptosporangiaceae bacterium]|nr:hypothetical protein [Streptosporangiaceae bacterium]
MAQQGPPPRRPARLPASGLPVQPAPRRHAADDGGPNPYVSSNPYVGSNPYPGQDPDLDDDQDLPPWAGLSISPRRPPRQGRESRPPRQGHGSGPRWQEHQPPDADEAGHPGAAGPGTGSRPRRAVAARARKARRKIYTWGGVAIAAAFIAAGAWQLFGPKAAVPRHSNFVTTYQPGDFRSVPNACRVIPAATLNQYLPDHYLSASRARVASLGGSRSESQCTWTLDAKPLYRVLEVTAQAYAPSLLATGNGSATFSAMDSYGAARRSLANPPKKTHLPRATVTGLAGLGDSAFSALQVISAGADRTDLVTVVVRKTNALVTVVFQGLDHSSRGGYGPVSITQLRAGAVAAAREVLAGLH